MRASPCPVSIVHNPTRTGRTFNSVSCLTSPARCGKIPASAHRGRQGGRSAYAERFRCVTGTCPCSPVPVQPVASLRAWHGRLAHGFARGTRPIASNAAHQPPTRPTPPPGIVQASFHVPWGILFDPSGTLQARNRHGLGTVFHQYLATVILAGNTHLLQWKGLTVAFQKIAITPIVLRSIKGSEAST